MHTQEKPMTDLTILDEGTVVLFQLNTDIAREFVDENVQIANWQWLGNRSFAVEHRYAGNLIAGMQKGGLTVE